MQTVYRVDHLEIHAEDGGVWIEEEDNNGSPMFVCFDAKSADEICAAIMKAKSDAEAE